MKGFTVISIYRTVLLACIAVVLGMAAPKLQAQQVQSDYEIQKNFTEEVSAIQSSLDTLGSVNAAGQVIDRIKELESEYSDHEELLNIALYPATFEDRLEELKRRTVAVRQRLVTIEGQSDMLGQLNRQLASYSGRLDSLNSRTDSLRNAIASSTKNERGLSNRLRSYRESLEQRDRLVLSIIDSVLIAYEDMEIESMGDLENAREQSRIDAGGSPLKLFRSIAAENVQFIDSTRALSTGDYLRMNVVHHEFKSMWDKMGDRLVDVYGDDENEQIRGTIENLISEWDKKVSASLWDSMNRSFDETGIDMGEFSDSETFYAALNEYLDLQIEQSKESTFEDTWKRYQTFTNFWNNQVKTRWTMYMTSSDLLTEEQIAAIDQKMSRWTVEAEPASNMLAFLLGFSLLAVLVLGGILYREKSNHK